MKLTSFYSNDLQCDSVALFFGFLKMSNCVAIISEEYEILQAFIRQLMYILTIYA